MSSHMTSRCSPTSHLASDPPNYVSTRLNLSSQVWFFLLKFHLYGSKTTTTGTMAPESQGRGALHSYGVMATGSGNMGPPSTLAAQLVETISPSATSSRPDETQELKRLFGIIERVKNHPDLLRTPEEHIAHNHMLIYVYTRVALDGLRWDEPFADRALLCAEALKAINFLKVTIKETPEVLGYSTDGKAFLFRGHEPLWLWILPKVLKLLGHPSCTSLAVAIEGLCSFIIYASSRLDVESSMTGNLIRYFRVITQGRQTAVTVTVTVTVLLVANLCIEMF